MKGIYTMVGMRFRGAEGFVSSLKSGAAITLVRDPNNKHDQNAVKVFVGERFVAFIKATEVRGLANSMDGRGVARVEGRFAVTADRYPAVEVDE
jgi:HIRAN domain